MRSLKEFFKTNNISKIEHGAEYSRSNRIFWFNFYRDFFISIMLAYYEWINVPESIDRTFLEKALIFNGYCGFFETKEFGLICSKGALSRGLDIYNNPTHFTPVNNSAIKFPTIPVNWYTDDLDRNNAIIVRNNSMRKPSVVWLNGFCQKLADIEMTIQLNRNAQVMPYLIIADDNNLFSMKNIFNKIMNFEPVIYLKEQKTKSADMEFRQLKDRIFTLDTKSEYLLDKLHDERQRVIGQILTIIGINNIAVDKAERLITSEANGNNGLINACIEVSLTTRQRDAERLNKCFGLNIEVMPSERIEAGNSWRIMQALNAATTKFVNENEHIEQDGSGEVLNNNIREV